MNENLNLCMGCMKPINSSAVICPHCAYNMQTVQQAPFLPTQTLLSGRYIIGKVLSFNASSAQYIGFDTQLNIVVKIQEFLPEKMITRPTNGIEITVKAEYEHLYYECLGSFESLWKTLQSFYDFSVIDTVYDVFFLNNTAYAVCEYVPCMTLDEFFISRHKLLSWNRACTSFKPIMAALLELGKIGIIHANLSPQTVLVTSDGKLRLSSFGIFQALGNVEAISQPPVDGYAPIERYNDCSHLSSATDVYSVAALMYTAITGMTVPDARQRVISDFFIMPKAIENKMPPEAAEAFRFALAVFPTSRMQTFDGLINAFVPVQEQPQTVLPSSQQAMQPALPETKNETDESNQQKQEQKEEVSTASVFIKTFVCAVIVLLMVFTTMYTTFLYNYIDIPFLNSAFSAFNFLPMNFEATEASVSENAAAEQETTANLVEVPDFTQYTYELIEQNEIFNRNFNLVYAFEYSNSVSKNNVISQSIPSGQSIAQGSTITVVISSGADIIVLKNVVGLSYDEAYNQLTSDGFTVVKEVVTNGGSHTENVVCEMSLVEGLNYERGTEITLSVWGPAN